VTNEWTQLAMSHGKLFLNLSGSLVSAASVLGVDAKSMGHSVCGRIVEELHEPAKRAFPVRLLGMLRLLRYLQQADKVIAEFTPRADRFALPLTGTSAALAKALEDAQPFFYEAFCVHLQSSTTSGFASNVLQAIVSGGQETTPEEEAEAARLLAGASGVESAVLVEQLDHIVELVAAEPQAATEFSGATTSADALAWLNSITKLKTAFDAFLERHGHRSYRELCVRELAWRDNPEALIAIMQASVSARLAGNEARKKPSSIDESGTGLGLALRWILPKAHRAVRRREASKSQLVSITYRLKRCYHALGEQLAREQRLEDADQVFFFTHDELMRFAGSAPSEQDADWCAKARSRRTALDFQNQMDFDEICVGSPKPIDRRQRVAPDDNGIVGRPVSRGIVEGVARVAFSVEEAAGLQPGEILVAPITDVGWTPYFSMIAGLVTDVGSAVSHGAVIAREYGLPAIVNTRTATRMINTGDRIRLDADTGTVTLL
jgi:pyruvate,water dikinase